MRAQWSRRSGLVLATVLVLLQLPPALDVHPDPETGGTGPAGVVAGIALVSAAATLALLVPAWRGGRRASTAVALLQVGPVLSALPAFFVPPQFVPPQGVLQAAVGCLLSVTAMALVLLEVSAALLHTATAVVLVGLYASLVALASAAVPAAAGRSVQTTAAITVALLCEPVLRLLRGTVRRSVFGSRGDPAGTALHVARSLGEGPGVLTTAAGAVSRALRLPRVEVLDSGEPVADSAPGAGASAGAVEGVAPQRTAVVPLDGEGRSSLRVTLRAGERRLHGGDRSALELVALPLGLLVRQSALVRDLRAARASAAQAREQERTLLHRDLHDGLGPLLTGAVLRSDAARNLLSSRPDAALAQLDLARSDLRTAIDEVRRVVYGLRPLELEQRGLWASLARRCEAAGASLHLPDPPPDLPAATELAVYRIVMEALTNVERHAPGAAAAVTVSVLPDGLEVEVLDTGGGAPAGARAGGREGVGLASLRARAEELGGRALAGPHADGWRVGVRLPTA